MVNVTKAHTKFILLSVALKPSVSLQEWNRPYPQFIETAVNNTLQIMSCLFHKQKVRNCLFSLANQFAICGDAQ